MTGRQEPVGRSAEQLREEVYQYAKSLIEAYETDDMPSFHFYLGGITAGAGLIYERNIIEGHG